MRDINSIIDRMKQATSCRTDTELAEYLGLKSNSAVSTWKARERIPYPECDTISQRENVDIGYLLTGKQAGASIFPKPLTGQITADKQDNNLKPVMIPQYDVQASAGGGVVVHKEAIIDYLGFSERWILKRTLNKDKLCLIEAHGDSMESTLNNNDLLLVDMRQNELNKDGIYVIQRNGHLLVKRIQAKLDGTVIIRSDNTLYEPETLVSNENHDLTIIGEVVWYGRAIA